MLDVVLVPVLLAPLMFHEWSASSLQGELIVAVRAELARLEPAGATKAELLSLYSTQNASALWIGHDGRPNAASKQALALLSNAAADGLDPADYDTAELNILIARLSPGAPDLVHDAARFELGSSARMRQIAMPVNHFLRSGGRHRALLRAFTIGPSAPGRSRP